MTEPEKTQAQKKIAVEALLNIAVPKLEKAAEAMEEAREAIRLLREAVNDL